MKKTLAVDIGGTFTDFVEFNDGVVRTWKTLSTPSQPAQAVLSGLSGSSNQLVHGSTIATNAILERKGAKTVLITTAGFQDLLQIRRQEREKCYDLTPNRTPHVTSRDEAIAVNERIDAHGRIITPLTEKEISRVQKLALQSGAETFAICFLFSFLNNVHESQIARALRAAGLHVVVSSEVSPEYREYERASTTALNAFLQPTIRSYLDELSEKQPDLRIMHSAGGLTSAELASERPVSLVMSGPAGGVLGALKIAQASDLSKIITFDMGGTSTDVALCDGSPNFRNTAEIDGLTLQTSLIDIITVGAGGGSLAKIDDGGALTVGPESAGAHPGPACYGTGTEATVTDANLVLGRLRTAQLLGGKIELNLERSRTALGNIGEPSSSAKSVIEVTNATMAKAIRKVSVERGYEPEDFSLVAFGGAGPLHACELAQEVGIKKVLIPSKPGVLSAIGIGTATEVIERSETILLALSDPKINERLVQTSKKLESQIQDDFSSIGKKINLIKWSVDARYKGQAHELRTPILSPSDNLASSFHKLHEKEYGFANHKREVQIVALRCRGEGKNPHIPVFENSTNNSLNLSIEIEGTPSHLYSRDNLPKKVQGPMVITQSDTTIFIPPGWQGREDDSGNLILDHKNSE